MNYKGILKYEAPTMDIVALGAEDVIATSGFPGQIDSLMEDVEQ